MSIGGRCDKKRVRKNIMTQRKWEEEETPIRCDLKKVCFSSYFHFKFHPECFSHSAKSHCTTFLSYFIPSASCTRSHMRTPYCVIFIQLFASLIVSSFLRDEKFPQQFFHLLPFIHRKLCNQTTKCKIFFKNKLLNNNPFGCIPRV